MDTKGILTVLVMLVTLAAGSDILKAEVLTGFDASPDMVSPGQETKISITNTGIVQADNAVVLIAASDTIANYTDICAEGKVTQQNNTTLVVEFTRMTPNMQCVLDLDIPKPVSLDVTIGSDGRIQAWKKGQTTFLVPILIIVGMIGIIFVEVVIIYSVAKIHVNHMWYKLKLRLERESLKETAHVSPTIKFVYDEYKVKIDEADATVLELIYCRKTTKRQLTNYSGLSKSLIDYRIDQMSKKELISKDTLELNKILLEHFNRQPRKTTRAAI